ncbi:MAG: hypothetical protein A2W91_17355 [Bacteroidetes bacterium GWF2_38_335]|nr:MAG: hypothetical protein A2W91_17355 [Bacteroidetes bacterium GWF2_38_335]OFY78632.1 MAG: hypothetical protein A2281_16380 [Bacteroidetes bacterium RIFOXYA12_FULL_38_20]HBS88372.1 hypothetical protein [Bacteroidales bacterium]
MRRQLFPYHRNNPVDHIPVLFLQLFCCGFHAAFILRTKLVFFIERKWGVDELRGRRWRYEKLPFAGDFLSSYTKVEAGYNP